MEQTGPRRSPSAGGYARGSETRRRIIEAAIQVFGREGFARASTRQIAQEASVTPPALQYYFDSKEGLHRACAEFILEQAWVVVGPPIEAAEALDPAKTPRPVLIDHVCRIVEAMADAAFGDAQMDSRKQFMARGQVSGGSLAHELIRERFIRRLHFAVAGLMAGIFERPEPDEDILLRSIAIFGQVGAFSVGRPAALASLGWSDLSGDRLGQVKAVLTDQTRAILAAPPADAHGVTTCG